VDRTVRTLLADRPLGRGGLSARLMGKRGGTGCSGANNGSSTPGCRTVRAPRGPSAGASWTVRTCRTSVGPRSREVKSIVSSLFPKPQEAFPSLSFLLYLKEKAPSLGILIRALPGPSEHFPGLSARFSTMSSGYFFRISHSLSRILSKKVIRVW
jgi:hypothetical protein